MRPTEPMSGLNPDAIDEGVSGVSYPPNLADAKEEGERCFLSAKLGGCKGGIA